MDSIRLVGTIAGRRRILTLRKDDNVVGSANGADFVLDDPSVAPRHARIWRVGDKFQISALDGEVRLNDRPVGSPTIIRPKDEVHFGALSFVVEAIAGAEASPPRPPEQPPSLANKPQKQKNFRNLIAFVGILGVIGFVAALAFVDWDLIETVADGNGSPTNTSFVHSTTPEQHATPTQLASAEAAPTLSVVSTPPPTPSPELEDPASAAWLRPLNAARKIAGLPAVTADPVLNAGNTAHARYLLAKYGERVFDIGGEIHTEDPADPGYSEAGSKAAQSSNIAARPIVDGRLPTPAEAIDGWLQTPFHQLWVLNPNLAKAGYGEACNGKACVEVLDILSDVPAMTAKANPLPTPIEFPPANSTFTLKTLESEWPDPLASCPGFEPPAGFPITLQLGSFVPVRLSHFSLVRNDPAKTPLEVCAFTAESYANPDSSQVEKVQEVMRMFGAVALIPRFPLQPGSYTVSMTTDREYTWSFSIK